VNETSKNAPTTTGFAAPCLTNPIYGPSWPLQREQPFQKWNALGPSAEGLLVATRTSAGPVIDWSTSAIEMPEPPGRPPATYLFVEGSFSPWGVYFTSTGEGYNFLSNWQVPTSNGVKLFDAAAFEPTTSNPWGLNLEAHLVKVQVNHGDGSSGGMNGGPHFVVTNAEVLDGSTRTPIVPSRSLSQGAGLWKRWLTGRNNSIKAALDQADKQTPGIRYGAETTVIRSGISPTWDSGTQQLRVRFYQHRERRSQIDPGLQASRCKPQGIRSYGVETAIELLFNRNGKLVGRRDRPPVPSPGIAPSFVPNT
jgi:hypothetical protein